MSDSLPIVPGCLALTLPYRNAPRDFDPIANTIVTCVRLHATIKHAWLVDSDKVRQTQKEHGMQYSYISEKYLIRIDGGDFESDEEAHELECPF